MIKKTILLLMLIFFSFLLLAENPLFGGSKEHAAPQKQEIGKAREDQPGFFQKLKHKLVLQQKKLYRQLYKEKKKSATAGGMLLLMMITFAYGFLHALGPGHGKLFITGYYFANKAKPMQGIISGTIIGLLHALSGVILVIILQFILKLPVNTTSDNLRNQFQIVSYTVLLLIGCYLLYRSLAHDCHHHEQTSLWGLILTIGLIPCPGAVMISIFGITILESIFATMLLIFSMGIGMSIAISLFSLIPTLAHSVDHPILKNKIIFKIFGVGGSLLIILISGVFLTASL